MPNSLLSPTAITRESLRILHQRLNFIGTIERQYDDQFAKTGAKIGQNLTIRKPNQYTVRTGQVMVVQDTIETSVVLTVSTIKGVDMQFDGRDLTLTIDKFSDRYIAPAMTVLASAIEADALNMLKDVNQEVAPTPITAKLDSATVLNGRKKLSDALVPQEPRIALVPTQMTVDLVSTLQPLFNAQSELATQYKEGSMGRFAGFDFYENTLLGKFTSGTETAAGTIAVSGASQTGSAITVTNASTKTLVVGDVITLPGVNRVHPETKADTGVPMQFVVTAPVATNGTTINISPAIVTTGAQQNVTASPTAAAITKVGGPSGVMDLGILYHKEAFAFATADLIMPNGAHFAAREVQDGISMRIWTGTDIVNNLFPTRVDVLYGYKTLRPEMACRIVANSTA
jgi:P22 coat protein - gene protein 5